MTDQTPRLPSSFPMSPRSRRPSQYVADSFQQSSSVGRPPFSQPVLRSATSKSKLPTESIQTTPTTSPLISLEIADAPTQRMYAVGVFFLLQMWKMYDLSLLYASEENSLTELRFSVKWLLIDGCYIWFLPSLRIPWLTFTQSITLGAIAIFSIVDIFLSLKYSFPIATLFGSIWKLLYDRELSISERSVKWHDIVHNTSHIQGKYTVHILPEGAAKLNPDGKCFCLGPTSPSVTLPIRINGTQPISISLERIDLETAVREIIELSHKDVKKLLKKAPREDTPELKTLPYVVKKPGLYRLSQVKDVSELDVRVHRSEAMVVTCPKATIRPTKLRNNNMCKGDMSDLLIELKGLAPLHVTYSRILNGKPTTLTVERLHPENYESPLFGGFSGDGSLTEHGGRSLEWAKSQNIGMPLNEPLDQPGSYIFEIEKVGDGCGNVVDYKAYHDEQDSWSFKSTDLAHAITVHKRPLAKFMGCNTQSPMDLPKGRTAALPISVDGEPPYTIRYAFTPTNKLGDGTEHAVDSIETDDNLKSAVSMIQIENPGLYSIRSVSNVHCSGDVLEPSTCLVITPPNPSLTMEHDQILDKCSGSSIGLTIDLTLVGSPPFSLSYRRTKDGGTPTVETLHIDQSRYQTRFTPADAGHYIYEFFSLDDKNYLRQQLEPSSYRVEQTVKPLAGAEFVESSAKKACIDQTVDFEVKMQGTPPLTLNYDLIYGGKRSRFTVPNITQSIYTITTPPLMNGGEYAVTLTSVQDESGCKSYLEKEAKILVRFQRPKAQFAQLDGKYRLDILEGKSVDIPMRFTGEAPWVVIIKNIDSGEPLKELVMKDANTGLTVSKPGTYQIQSVRDSACPGTVTESQKKFTVGLIKRPEIRLPVSSSLALKDDKYVRNDICEGDEDAVELAFTGKPPFVVDWERSFKGSTETRYVSEKTDALTAGLGFASVRLESSRPGQYRYRFFRMSDSLYDDPKDRNIQKPLVLEQNVHARPDTAFANPNKVYKYCLDSAAGEESIIPIQLSGIPPFALTLNVKHYSTGKSDTIHLPNIDSNYHDFKIPPHALTLGDHAVSVVKIKDSRGCVRKTVEGSHVMVAVADMPTISPSDQRIDYCVGERIAFTLSGVPPFAVEYNWNAVVMKAANQPPQFVRVAERPGNFTILGLQDSASDCKVNLKIDKIIHEVPSVRISEGSAVVKGIPEGDQAEILFTFFGTPPFTFTYTRSEIVKKGLKPRILEMHSHSTESYTYSLYASQEGTYEVISIEDKYCSYSASSSSRKQ